VDWYERGTGNAGYQVKSGNTKFSSSFSDYIINDIQKTSLVADEVSRAITGKRFQVLSAENAKIE